MTMTTRRRRTKNADDDDDVSATAAGFAAFRASFRREDSLFGDL